MKIIFALLAGCGALELVRRDVPAVVSLSISRRDVPILRQHDSRLRRRSKVLTEILDNFEEGSLYFANATLGTPPQSFRFHIDTGSSDLWTNAASSQLCEEPTLDGDVPCSISGTYAANSSSSYNYVDSQFSIRYADGSGASGDYVSDTLTLAGASFPVQFGVGYESTSPEGVLGIGYASLEVQATTNGEPSYANVPLAMVQQGLIHTPTYSLWLDDLASSTGSIMFGGVDTSKYAGSLHTVPIIQETINGQSLFLEMLVALNQVNLVDGANTTISTTSVHVLLDSGSTLSYLPSSITTNIYKALGVTWDANQQAAFCSCDLANSSATIEFLFDGQPIPIGMTEMVISGGLSSASEGCTFGIFQTASSGSTTGNSGFTLGDTFLRSAYAVYDLANNQISLAPTNFASGSSNIMEITNGIPHVSGVSASSTTKSKTSDGSVFSRGGIGFALALTAYVVWQS